MTKASKMAVAIPAFRRADLLQRSLEALPSQQVSRVYIGVDGPRPGLEEAVAETVRTARRFASDSGLETLVKVRPTNVGTAVNVLGTISWMFSREPVGAVLEDDCVPGRNFFEFAKDALEFYRQDPSVWMVSGSQLAPIDLISGTHVLSPYGLIWGWATTREKWSAAFRNLKSSLVDGLPSARQCGDWLKGPEKSYWRSGHRRAAEGWVDSWALPLTAAAIFSGRRGILPPVNLVHNIGNDSRSTHTSGDTRWTRRPPSESELMRLSMPLPDDDRRVNDWLRSNLFEIGMRHEISTKVTLLLDKAKGKPIRSPLKQRLQAEGI